MNESTVLRDGQGNYYTFPPDVLAVAQTAQGTYEMAEEAVVVARVPDDGVDAAESALGIEEVSGYGDPIPGVDVKVGRNPPVILPMTNLGTFTVGRGDAKKLR
jgi:hypothetical protein